MKNHPKKPFLFLCFIFLLASCVQIKQEPVSTDKVDSGYPADYDPEKQLSQLGITLQTLSTPVANYVHVVRSGNLLFLAGKGSRNPDGSLMTGKLGADLEVQEGYEGARSCAIAHLSVLKAELGDLRKVKRVVKVLGMVNSSPDFGEQPEVINGYSDLMVEVFGERGKHARSAVGMGALPRNLAVEVEVIVEVAPE